MVRIRESGDRVSELEQRIAEGRTALRAGSFEWELRSGVLRWSDELCRIYGIEPAEFGGTPAAYYALVHPDDREGTARLVREVFENPHGVTYEHRVVRRDGSLRILYSRVDLITDRAGQPLDMIGTCWDVTDRRTPDDSPESTLGLLRAVLEASADGILVVDRLGELVTFNERFLTLWHIPRELAQRRSDQEALEFVLPQLVDSKSFLERVHALYARPEADSFEVLRFKDGRVFERYSRPHRIGAAIVGRVWTFHDVTERETLLARQTLLADASRLLSSLDLEPALAALVQVAVPFLGWACAIDLVRGEGTRRIASAALPEAEPVPARATPVEQLVASFHEHDGRSEMVVPLRQEDEDTRTTRVVGAIAFAARPDRPYTADDLAIAEELGHRIELELDHERLVTALRDAVRTRDDFLSIAAHEIRGPLTSIRLAIDHLRAADVPASQREHLLALAAREDRRLARFVDELVDLIRIRSGLLELEVEDDVDLSEIVREVVRRLDPELASSGSRVVLDLPAEPVRGRWDRFRTDQVMTNLLSNAVKFGVGKAIEISVRATAGTATVTVTDHGIGVAPELRERIFEPFERGVSVRHYGGLGLGLFIVRMIVTLLGGTVRVEPVDGGGSRFVVDLPRARST